jgi:hypothetical protein
MIYYIFLKSLRRLEEFRKNPHIKILPKSPCANFQNLDKFKILIQKFFSSLSARPTLRPTRPLAQPAQLASLLSRTESNPAGPASPRVDGVFTGVHFPFWFAPSELIASPSSLCQAGPGYQLRPSPPAARARPRRHRLPATPHLGCHRAVTTPPSSPPP